MDCTSNFSKTAKATNWSILYYTLYCVSRCLVQSCFFIYCSSLGDQKLQPGDENGRKNLCLLFKGFTSWPHPPCAFKSDNHISQMLYLTCVWRAAVLWGRSSYKTDRKDGKMNRKTLLKYERPVLFHLHLIHNLSIKLTEFSFISGQICCLFIYIYFE